MTDLQPQPLRSTVLVVDDEAGPRESLRMILAPNYERHGSNRTRFPGESLYHDRSTSAVSYSSLVVS